MKSFAMICATVIGSTLFAAPSIEITNVQQQYPWTNTVDVAYQVTGITDRSFYAVFEARTNNLVIGVVTNELIGTGHAASDVITLTTQWQPPFDIQARNVTMVPYVYRGGIDAGNDYLVVDLDTGAYTYEGMINQDFSNRRYNTDDTANVYKTSKMVFRKVKAGTYTIAGSMDLVVTADALYDGVNHQVSFPADYYIAIFRLTRGQYARMTGDTSASELNNAAGLVNHPKIIRGNAGHKAVAAGPIGTLCSRISGNSSNKAKGLPALKIDIPNHAMAKVAHAAGKAIFWADGNTSVTPTTNVFAYIWCKESNTPGYTRENCPLGKKLPNEWGLYDVSGIDMISVMDQTATIHYETEEPKLGNNFMPIINRTDYWCFVGGSQAITIAYNNTAGNWPARNSLNANWYSLSNYGQHRLAVYPAAYYPNGGQ